MNMVFIETVITFLQKIIKFPDFKTCSASLQQQIKHLLFLATIADVEEWEAVKEEHNMILEDINEGYVSWDNAEYFEQWQSKILQLVNFSSDLIDSDVKKDEYMKIDNNALNTVWNEFSSNTVEDQVIGPIEISANEEALIREEEGKTSVERKEPLRLRPNVMKSNVHHEFIQTKVGKKIASKCKHCPVQYSHKICHRLKHHLRITHFEVYRKVVISDRNSLRQEECKRQTMLHLKEKFSRKLKEMKSRNVENTLIREECERQTISHLREISRKLQEMKSINVNNTEDTDNYEKEDLKGMIGGGGTFIVTKLNSSSVHKEFIQTKVGEKKWSSKCKHCHRRFNHKDSFYLKNHLNREHIEVYMRVENSDKMSLRKQEESAH